MWVDIAAPYSRCRFARVCVLNNRKIAVQIGADRPIVIPTSLTGIGGGGDSRRKGGEGAGDAR